MNRKSFVLVATSLYPVLATQAQAEKILLACEITSGVNRGNEHRIEIDTLMGVAMIDGFLPADILELDDKISLMVQGRSVREFLPHLCSATMCVGELIIIDRYLGTIVWANYFSAAGTAEEAHRGDCVPHSGERLF